MSTITTQDGTQIYYNDWGNGQPVVFSHGWPLSADAWEDQMFYLASRGYRCIAHDRRGHGRSSQPWQGNDLDTYADDLAALVRALDLRELLFRLLSAVAAGQAPAAADLDAFNDAAAGALSRSTVEPVDGRFRRGWAADGADRLDLPAWEVARDARELLLDPAAIERLKQCPGPECGWLFLDESRNRSRRWCDPRLCGNRERVKSHYRRRQASATP
jgi:predicted RNA-binding Zn ribbon-like protein